jgi:hypothetical protein
MDSVYDEEERYPSQLLAEVAVQGEELAVKYGLYVWSDFTHPSSWVCGDLFSAAEEADQVGCRKRDIVSCEWAHVWHWVG